MEYAAHYTRDGRIQTVKEHLLGVAERGKVDSELISMPCLYRISAILHDMGKNTSLSDEYQRTVGSGGEWKKERVIHSNCGGRYVYEKFMKSGGKYKKDKYTSEIIASVIMSHHGLFDFACPKKGSDKENGFILKLGNSDYDYEECKSRTIGEVISEQELEELYKKAKDELTNFMEHCNNKPKKERHFNFSMLIRILLSIVVNSDHSDTAEFVSGRKQTDICGNSEMWKHCCEYFEAKIKSFNRDTELNAIRAEISDKAAEYAKKPDSIVRMTVPTGGGKTLSSLRYALHHAEIYGKSRIFYVAPFNSILEQNYHEIKAYLPDDVQILPHFGNMLDRDYSEGSETEQALKYSALNWSTPVIATSMVQLLNSLFDGKISSIRRMRGLINSVIVIDEVQSVPIECLTLFNMGIRFLAKVCKCTVVLCTATQPPFEALSCGIENAAEMIDGFESYGKKMERTKIKDKTMPEAYTADAAAELLYSLSESAKTVLCIVNTKKAAFKVFKALETLVIDEDIKLVHLSTNMCPKHRSTVIEDMKERMRQRQRLICVSTQLIEAGVDISFEAVVRSLAGTDSIIQAAGRCNRNFEHDMGYVYIINLREEDENISALKSIKTGVAVTRDTLHNMKHNPKLYGGNLLLSDAIHDFYTEYYTKLKEDSERPYDFYIKDYECSLFEMLSTNGNGEDIYGNYEKTLLKSAMRTAGECFEVIHDRSEAVLVPYGKGKELIAELLSDKEKDYASLIKEAQYYSVALPKSKLGGSFINTDKTGIRYLSEGYYSDIYGFCEKADLDFCCY